jgi:hypothetical protein
MAMSFKDAFYQTESGKTFVAQTNPREIADRVRTLKDTIPNDAYHASAYRLKQQHWALFNEAKYHIRLLGTNGGTKYEAALNAAKHLWSPVGVKFRDGVKKTVYDKTAYEDALEAIFNS